MHERRRQIVHPLAIPDLGVVQRPQLQQLLHARLEPESLGARGQARRPPPAARCAPAHTHLLGGGRGARGVQGDALRRLLEAARRGRRSLLGTRCVRAARRSARRRRRIARRGGGLLRSPSLADAPRRRSLSLLRARCRREGHQTQPRWRPTACRRGGLQALDAAVLHLVEPGAARTAVRLPALHIQSVLLHPQQRRPHLRPKVRLNAVCQHVCAQHCQHELALLVKALLP
mmetsp:Transcript_50163/g.95836  ORF Transcript_50163/g.95836 Transcript_50163/m.95836 type:complete len:231 (-) Transcript_50163:454-1146(-)